MNNSADLVPEPPVDPNLRQNRVPSQTELVTLRNIRAHKRQLVDITKRQLDTTLEEHRRIQARHDQLLRDLEAVQSELNISHSYLKDLRIQLEQFQAEDNRLTGLLHPIRRYPQDILILIFKWATEIDDGIQLQIANKLSQVCKSWRVAALSTACLWSQVQISMKDSVPPLKSFMKRTKSRLRNYPPEIELFQIGACGPKEMEKIMDQVQLRRFKSIKSLKYHLTESDDLQNLSHPCMLFSPASVGHVSVEAVSESGDPDDWDCSCILDQSPDIRSLELEVHTNVIFEGDQIYPALRKLSIRKSSAPSLLLRLSKFPGIQELRIDSQFAMHPPSEDIILPQLQVLHIQDVFDFPWSQISAPHLRELVDDDSNSDYRAIDFCSRHPSIVKLIFDTWIEEDQFRSLAKSLPNLEYLNAGGDLRGMYLEGVSDIPFPPFPKLESLVVDDTGNHRLSLAEFESFVTKRLLPQYSQENSTFKQWRIIVKIDEIDRLPWRKSDLFSRLHETRQNFNSNYSMHSVILVPK